MVEVRFTPVAQKITPTENSRHCNGFGPEHEFGRKGAKKQIGNAVPPIVGAEVLGSVVDALKKEDGISGE